jgi:hypothetical protein
VSSPIQIVTGGTDWSAITAAIVTGVAAIVGIGGTAWQAKRAREAASADLKASIDAAAANTRAEIDSATRQYHLDRLTDTYMQILQGVHVRDVRLTRLATLPREKWPASLAHQDDDEYEMRFVARLMAYASPEMAELWYTFHAAYEGLTRAYEGVRARHSDTPPATQLMLMADPVLKSADAAYGSAKNSVVARIRSELGTSGHVSFPGGIEYTAASSGAGDIGGSQA